MAAKMALVPLVNPLRVIRHPGRLQFILQSRFYTVPVSENVDIRQRLMSGVKTAIKTKDTVTSTTYRSVLSEIYAADKSAPSGKIDNNGILSIIRKAASRRQGSAAQYQEAKRDDLALVELQEAGLLSSFLPPLLTAEEVDGILRGIIGQIPSEVNPRQKKGLVLKEFFSKVDDYVIDQDLLKKRMTELLSDN